MDKLEWDNNALSLMEYIGIIESFYIPDLEDYDYIINVTRCEASAEAIEEAGNIPFGATDCMVIFKSRFNQRQYFGKFLPINKNKTIESVLAGSKLH